MEQIPRDIEEYCDWPRDYKQLQQLGDCYRSTGDLRKANDCYNRAASADPDQPAPYVGLGMVAFQKDEPENADIAFRVAARLDPNCSKAYMGIAMVAQQKGLYKQSFDMYLKSLELDTDNLTSLLGLFQASCQMGSFARVIHFLEVYLKTHPSDTSVMFSLATLYMKENRLEQAEKLLQNIIRLDSQNSDAADLLEEVQHDIACKNAPEVLAV